MRLDQARHQREARQFDYLRIARRIDAARWSNSFDLLTTNQHHPVVMHLRRLTVKAVSRLEQVDSLWRLGLLRLGKSKSKKHETEKEAHHFSEIRTCWNVGGSA